MSEVTGVIDEITEHDGGRDLTVRTDEGSPCTVRLTEGGEFLDVGARVTFNGDWDSENVLIVTSFEIF